MRVAWLDALPVGTTSETVRRVLEAAAADPGGELTVRAHRLEEARFAPCRGCFACWVEHPGTCRAKDSANAVMPDIIGADGVLWTTAPRFGAWVLPFELADGKPRELSDVHRGRGGLAKLVRAIAEGSAGVTSAMALVGSSAGAQSKRGSSSASTTRWTTERSTRGSLRRAA